MLEYVFIPGLLYCPSFQLEGRGILHDANRPDIADMILNLATVKTEVGSREMSIFQLV